MIQDYFLIALKNVKRRKIRAWLTIIGVIIAITTIFLLISISLGLQGAVKEQFRLLGADKFIVQPKGQLAGPGTASAVNFTIDDAKTIEKVGGVKDISYYAVAGAQIEFNDQKRYLSVGGIPLDKSQVFIEFLSYKAIDGRTLGKNDENFVMIGYNYKYGNIFSKPVKVGDKLVINGAEFKVRGILSQVGNPQDDRLIYMPMDNFKSLFGTGDRVDAVLVQVDDPDSLKDVSARVEKRLLSSRDVTKKTQDFSIQTPEELLQSFLAVLNIITAFLIAIAAVSLVVGGIGIANTMYTSVLERTKEIGVMKAVGAKNSDILQLFMIESGLLGLVGGIIGVILGVLAGQLVQYIAKNVLGTTLLQVATPFYLIIGCLIFAFALGALFGILPAYQASKLKPVKALRYE